MSNQIDEIEKGNVLEVCDLLWLIVWVYFVPIIWKFWQVLFEECSEWEVNILIWWILNKRAKNLHPNQCRLSVGFLMRRPWDKDSQQAVHLGGQPGATGGEWRREVGSGGPGRPCAGGGDWTHPGQLWEPVESTLPFPAWEVRQVAESCRLEEACVHACVLSHFGWVWLCATLWTAARQAPLSMGLSRQEDWSGLPFPPSGDLLDPGIEPVSLTLLHCYR